MPACECLVYLRIHQWIQSPELCVNHHTEIIPCRRTLHKSIVMPLQMDLTACNRCLKCWINWDEFPPRTFVFITKMARFYLHLLCNETLYFAKKRANVCPKSQDREHPVFVYIQSSSIQFICILTQTHSMVIIQNIRRSFYLCILKSYSVIFVEAMIEYSENDNTKRTKQTQWPKEKLTFGKS